MARKLNIPPCRPLAERFEEKVDRSGGPEACHPWTGSRTTYGHGTIMRESKGPDVIASRVAWELAVGPIPPGMCVCHNCPGGDNPACVNVRHLWLGTHRQNMQDKVAKGRHNSPTGARHASAKLHEHVTEIRALHANGTGMRELGRRFGVQHTSIRNLLRGTSYI